MEYHIRGGISPESWDIFQPIKITNLERNIEADFG